MPVGGGLNPLHTKHLINLLSVPLLLWLIEKTSSFRASGAAADESPLDLDICAISRYLGTCSRVPNRPQNTPAPRSNQRRTNINNDNCMAVSFRQQQSTNKNNGDFEWEHDNAVEHNKAGNYSPLCVNHKSCCCVSHRIKPNPLWQVIIAARRCCITAYAACSPPKQQLLTRDRVTNAYEW